MRLEVLGAGCIGTLEGSGNNPVFLDHRLCIRAVWIRRIASYIFAIMTSEAAIHLRSAVVALYSGGAGQPQQQANQWLQSFTHQPEAWEACLQLTDPAENTEISFFCAQMLLSKVRSEWHKIPQDQQSHMATIVR